jgi:hypothetical protein
MGTICCAISSLAKPRSGYREVSGIGASSSFPDVVVMRGLGYLVKIIT